MTGHVRAIDRTAMAQIGCLSCVRNLRMTFAAKIFIA
jgi:hypothetical protein